MKDQDNPCKGCQHHRVTSYSEYPGGKVWSEEFCAIGKDADECHEENDEEAFLKAQDASDLKFMEMTGDLDRLNEGW